MAFVSRPTASLSYTLQDASGSKSQININIPGGTLINVAFAAADALRPLIAALTDCAVIAQNITYSQADDAPAAAVAGSRVEEKGTFVWRTANARTTQITIPAIKDSLLLQSGAVDRDNLAVAAFVAGVTGADTIFAGADGSDIRSLAAAYQRFRSSTKNQLPRDR